MRLHLYLCIGFFFLLIHSTVALKTWVVQLKGHDQTHIEAFAMQHNLEYIGDLPHLPGYYAFKTTKQTNPAFGPQALLKENRKVTWMEQQHSRKHFKRSNDPQWASEWHLKGEPAGVHAEAAWNAPYNRRGSSAITIAIVDDGLQWKHPDLRPNFNSPDSWDYNEPQRQHDVTPYSSDGHGTSAAGVCCAAQNNHICGTGVCPSCHVSGIRLIASGVSDFTESKGLSHHDLPIYSCSWGPADTGNHFSGPGTLLLKTFDHQTKHGRQGKGTIYVWAGGNGRHNSDNVNYDGYANSRFTIAVGAIHDRGQYTYYSEPGACLLCVTPSSGGSGHRGISTTDLTGSNGYSSGSCTSRFGGTSSSCPLAAGIIGLLLEQRPDLSWRDVQHVIALGATKLETHSADWSRNHRGYSHHHDYGFGNLVIPKLLDTAKSHTLVPKTQRVCSSGRLNAHAPLPYTKSIALDCSIDFVEHVELSISWSHARHGQVLINLESPEHVHSRLSEFRQDHHRGNKFWTFMSVRHWGEQQQPHKSWILRVTDSTPMDTYKGNVLWYELKVYGF